MIGFYDYTVVVTYISLVSSIVGMFCAIDGKLTIAIFCLGNLGGSFLSGILRTV